MADQLDEFKKILITKGMCFLQKDEKKEPMVNSIFESLRIDDIDIQALLDEITSLRQQVLDTQTTLNELQKTINV